MSYQLSKEQRQWIIDSLEETKHGTFDVDSRDGRELLDLLRSLPEVSGEPVGYVLQSATNYDSTWSFICKSKQYLKTGVPIYLAPQPAASLSKAWAEGYRAGIDDERESEANIGIAGFDAKVEPARNNPYGGKAPQPAAVPEGWNPSDKLMSVDRVLYFMERFKREEKLPGPHEQAAVDYVIAMLKAAPQPAAVQELVGLEDEVYDAVISWFDSNGICTLEPEQLAQLVKSVYITVRDAAPQIATDVVKDAARIEYPKPDPRDSTWTIDPRYLAEIKKRCVEYRVELEEIEQILLVYAAMSAAQGE